jgi:hypothetical protein
LNNIFSVFINYQQDDCFTLLQLSEFAYNNYIYTSTRFSPFYALTSYHSRWKFLAPSPSSEVPIANAQIQQVREIHFELQHHLGRAQARQKLVANRHHSVPPSFEVDDQVRLLRYHVHTS